MFNLQSGITPEQVFVVGVLLGYFVGITVTTLVSLGAIQLYKLFFKEQ